MNTRLGLLRFLRLRPFDTSTESGRADERHRRVALSAAATALARVLSLATMLISVPLTLSYLGSERYGMWMTMSSLIAMLGFADMGIGNGVLTAVAKAHGDDDRIGIRQYVSSGLCVLSGIGLAILTGFALAYAFIPWHQVFNVQSEVARAEAAPALAVFAACFALAIPTGIVQRVQMGLQQGFLASLWQCAGSAFGLLGVLFAIQVQAGLPWLVLGFVGGPLLASLSNSVLFFGIQHPDIAPGRASISRTATKQIAQTGAQFLVLQVVVSIAFASDSIVIAQLMGAKAVTDYAVPERLFGLVTMVVAMLVGPLWPAYGEAIARGDLAWVRQAVRRSVSVAFGFGCAAGAVLIFAGPWLIAHWVGQAVQTSLMLMVAFAVWKAIESTGTALAAFLNGANLLRFQTFTAILTAAVAVALKVILGRELGVPGILFATSFAWITCTGLPIWVYLRRHPLFKAPSHP